MIAYSERETMLNQQVAFASGHNYLVNVRCTKCNGVCKTHLFSVEQINTTGNTSSRLGCAKDFMSRISCPENAQISNLPVLAH